jgi:LemA protein
MKNPLVILGIVAIAILLGIGVFYLWAAGKYDTAVKKQEQVDASWADVQAAYQRRADLVPNLVATVKGAADNEKEILTRVTEARAGISRAKSPGEMEMFGREINAAINLAFEAYPEIRSTENFRDLQVQLEGTENRINKARSDYNEAVKVYNTHIRGFWNQKALAFIGNDEFERKDGFEAKAGAEDAPEVNFGN